MERSFIWFHFAFFYYFSFCSSTCDVVMLPLHFISPLRLPNIKFTCSTTCSKFIFSLLSLRSFPIIQLPCLAKKRKTLQQRKRNEKLKNLIFKKKRSSKCATYVLAVLKWNFFKVFSHRSQHAWTRWNYTRQSRKSFGAKFGNFSHSAFPASSHPATHKELWWTWTLYAHFFRAQFEHKTLLIVTRSSHVLLLHSQSEKEEESKKFFTDERTNRVPP